MDDGEANRLQAQIDALYETVYGDPGPGLLRRVEAVEDVGTKGFWVAVCLTSAIISGFLLVVVGLAIHWLGGG